MYIFADSDCLTIDNLNDVIKAVWEARMEWYGISLDLRISADDLDTIQKDHRDTKTCYMEMLKVWLRQTQTCPTWTNWQ